MMKITFAVAVSGALSAWSAQGQVYLFAGDAAGDWLGRSVSLAGDVNNDGFEDIIVGATQGHQTGAGYARIYSGIDGSILHTFTQGSPGDSFGFSVSGAGDVDRDGYDDVIVGAPFADYNGSQSGAVWAFSGFDGHVLYVFKGDATLDELGCVGHVGDVNSDGFADVVVGATQEFNGGAGYVRLFSGQDGSLLYQLDGNSPGDEFGRGVGVIGDINDDGHVDLFVTAFRADTNGMNAGSTYVFSGIDGSTLYTFDGDGEFDHFGHSCATVGDVDGDTYSDLAVGATQWTTSRLGYVRVFSGRDGSTIYTLNGTESGAAFGHAVSGAGDLDGDGFLDLCCRSQRSARFRSSGRA